MERIPHRKRTTRQSSTTLSKDQHNSGEFLTGDELSYLRALFAACEREEGGQTEIGLISAVGHEWPVRLFQEMENLSLYAEHGNYRLVFPLGLEGQAQGLRLSMQVPHIFDTRGQSRSWRAVVSEGEVHVADRSGRLTGLRAINISTSGICLSADEGAKAHGNRDIHLEIALPNTNKPMALKGTVVRSFSAGRSSALGIQFTRVDPEQEEAIGAYLLRAHAAERMSCGCN